MADEDGVAGEAVADVESDRASRSQWSETLARAQAMMVAEIGNGLFLYEPPGVLSVADPGKLKDLFGGGDPGRAESVRPLVALRRMLIPSRTHEADKPGSLVVGDPLYNDALATSWQVTLGEAMKLADGAERARYDARMFGARFYRTTPDGRTECVDPGAVKVGVPAETSRTATLQVYRDAALEIMKREGIENPEQYLVDGQRPPDAVRVLADAGVMGSYPHWLKTAFFWFRCLFLIVSPPSRLLMDGWLRWGPRMSYPEGLAYELHWPDGQLIRLYANGTTEGLPPGTIVINRVPRLMHALRPPLGAASKEKPFAPIGSQIGPDLP